MLFNSRLIKTLKWALIGVIILYLCSVIYKQRIYPVLYHFPIEDILNHTGDEIKIHLILFFSIRNCQPCLKPIINYLNHAPSYVQVLGVVKEEEIHLLSEFGDSFEAGFPIISLKRLRRYRTNYTPTLYGVGPDGRIYFVIPCTGREEVFLASYIDEFLRKAAHLLRHPSSK